VIKLPKKKYTPKQDVQLGKEAASEVRKQYPHHRGPAHREVPHADWQPHRRRGADGTEAIGLRVLVHAGEPERHQRVRAAGRTDVRATRHVDAAAEEAEVAGVMAHELSRVLLRHGTANASKAQNP
jgi:beta-barrel assembly-enhancing protease